MITGLPGYLLKNEKIDKRTFDILCKMRIIKDKVKKHASENRCVNRSDALDYGKNAGLLIEIINRMGNR